MTSSHSPTGSRSISSTILARVKLHEDQAWDRLFAVWNPIVYDWCRRKGVPPHDAEDIVQNVFLKVARTIHAFERQSFRRWIGRIAANAIADYYRNRAHRPVAFGGSGSWIKNLPDAAGQQQAERVEDARRNPQESGSPGEPDDMEESAERRADWLIVHQLLEVIRDDFQEHTFQAFWRTAVDGRSAVDVADELGMTPEAVRAARYRVLKRLREELEEMQ